ncbi:MAG: CapA family protein [Lachnospiraceae bacterium]|nr:CapA family protein [Lachnospiraceae bacterium]
MTGKWKGLFSLGVAVSMALCGCGRTAPTTAPQANTEYVLQATEAIETEESEEAVDKHPFDFTVCFGGDISLADDAVTTARMEASENGIFDCISPELVDVMQSADIMCLNNEFTYSTNGSPMEGKAYTFRANPARVAVLDQLGVDLVNLANNHVYDYGKQALLDTFSTLEEDGMPYFGAGRTLEEAMQPCYMEVDGKIIAFAAASRAEKNKMTPQATEDSPGILRCYDTTLFVEEIREADANADFVIAYVHWGTEYSNVLEPVQEETAGEYIDAGADAIIGAHPHCLQGIDYYNGAPIFYSLGNYWFNSKTLDTMLVQLHIYGDDEGYVIEPTIVPAIQTGSTTSYLTDSEDRLELYQYLMELSPNASIDENGLVHPSPTL